jgi:hypothetical protein
MWFKNLWFVGGIWRTLEKLLVGVQNTRMMIEMFTVKAVLMRVQIEQGLFCNMKD